MKIFTDIHGGEMRKVSKRIGLVNEKLRKYVLNTKVEKGIVDGSALFTILAKITKR